MGVTDGSLPVENLSDTTISMEIGSGTGLRASEDESKPATASQNLNCKRFTSPQDHRKVKLYDWQHD